MSVKIILRIFLLCLVFIQITGVAGALSLAEIGHGNTAGIAMGVAVSGNYAYVADYDNGLVIVDIRNPAAPTLVGSYDAAGYASGVAVAGSYAYVATIDYGLVIVDIRNPAAPVLAGSYNTMGSAVGVAVSGSYAYVANGAGGILVIDIRNPAAPTLAGSYNTMGSARDVAVSGSYTYVADGADGLLVVDISNPAAPALAGSYDTAGEAVGVAVSGSYVYVADFLNGLVILGEDTSGSISVTSSPSGASVYLYGEYKGTTPYTISSVSAGLHTIKLTNTGYVDLTHAVNVFSGDTTYFSGTLTLIPSHTGSISVSSSPSGASVSLNGAYKGKIPITLSNIPEDIY